MHFTGIVRAGSADTVPAKFHTETEMASSDKSENVL
jgi:hypothetical protein